MTNKSKHRSTVWEKLAWGAGGMTESLVNTINMLAMPIYSIALGVSPALIGLATAIPRLVDAFTDPIMGNVSDNARTRWGRRRPFIMIGSLLTGLCMGLIFIPNRHWPELGLFAWFTVMACLFYIGFTIWSIPWSAMGMEMSDDYNDRTRIQVARMVFATVAGLGVSWVYKLSFLFSSDEVVGVRPIVWIIGGVMAFMGLLSAVFVKEWRHVENQSKISLRPALKMTLSNKPFLLLCGAVIFFAGGMIMVEPMLLYVNIYHVFEGSRSAASSMVGISGTVGVIIALVMLPVGGWVSGKIGKRRAAMVALLLIIIGKGSQFWLVTPANPYLQLICRGVFQPGIMLMWALVPSMIADVCDLDELKSGHRREASFSSVYQWIWKLGATLAMTLGGLLLSLAGANVTGDGVMLGPDVVFRLRLILSVVSPLFAVVAFGCIWFYPLTEMKLRDIKQELSKRQSMSELVL